MMNISKKKIIIISALVGIFHFFMPILGILIGEKLLNIINIDPKYIITIIFSIIIMDLIKSLIVDGIESKIGVKEAFLFAFAVSLDSFSVGVGLAFLESNIFLCCLMFTISSFLFTFVGFKIGKFINKKIGKISKIIGIILLIILVLYFLK